jgi:thiosulfate/3-mercaptopyruvate sulfurtransferase
MLTTLISAEELTSRLRSGGDGLALLDCRARLGEPEYGRRVYAEGHLPGAVHVDLDTDLAAPPGQGGRHPLPDRAELAAKLKDRGLNDADQIVVYDDAGGAFAGRAWWCLRWLGHRAVALLDGGLAQWSGEPSTQPPPDAPGDFSLRPPLTRTVDADRLEASLATFTLVDARTRARFEGREEPIDPVAGHIPGAVCLPFQENLGTDGRFLDARTLARRFDGLGADVVCYCGSGVTAAHNVLAMTIAGLDEPILYPGSWSEWIVDPTRPRAP